MNRSCRAIAAALLATCAACAAAADAAPPLQPLPTLDVPAYMGTWYQVAWFPNRFSSKCGSATLLEPHGGRAGRSPALGALKSNVSATPSPATAA
jgi:hypothetical protein